jgi:hypothetical protein
VDFGVVVGLERPHDPEICTIGSVAIGNISQAGPFKGDNPAKTIPQSSRLEAGRGVDNSTRYVLLSRIFQQLRPVGEESRRGQHSDGLFNYTHQHMHIYII